MTKLGNWMDNLEAALERLSKRERYLVIATGIAFVIFVGFLISVWVSSSINGLQDKIERKTKQLQQLIDYRQEYEQAKRNQAAAKRIIGQGGNIQLMGTIETLAIQLSVKVEGMQPRPSVDVGEESNVIEEHVDVHLKSITIDRLMDYLQQLERKSRTIAIRKLHIKKNFQQPDHLEVNFSVSNFKLKPISARPQPAQGKSS
jgi:general secretion pathway protein M